MLDLPALQQVHVTISAKQMLMVVIEMNCIGVGDRNDVTQ